MAETMSPPSRRHHKTELNFWVMPNVGYATRPILQSYIQEFEKTHPDVKVRLTVLPWSLAWNRLMEVIKSRSVKSVPDVIQVGTTWVTTLSYLGALEKAPRLGGTDQEAATLGDASPFCIPWFIDIRVLYYRRDIFQSLGLDPRMLDDWAGFKNVCAEIQKGLQKGRVSSEIIAPLGIPGQKPGVLMHDLAPWVWEAGGDFCSEDMREANLSQEALIQGCEFYFDLIDKGYMPILNSALPQGNFFTGRYAMQFSGSWPVDTYLNPESPLATKEVANGFDVTLLPSGPQGRFTFLGGSNLSVTSISPNKDAAWEFIQFLTETPRLLSHARAIGALPPRLAGMSELFNRHPAAKNIFFNSFGHARRLPKLVELGSVEQIVYKMGLRVLSSIREKAYTQEKLRQEISAANHEIKALLSIHRYGSKVGKAA